MTMHRTNSPSISYSRSKAAAVRDLSAVLAQLEEQRRLRAIQIDELAVEAAAAAALGDDQSRQVTRVLTMTAMAALAEIDSALDRVAANTYGICERCDERVPAERLEVLPMTPVCTRCQSLIETRRSGEPRRR